MRFYVRGERVEQRAVQTSRILRRVESEQDLIEQAREMCAVVGRGSGLTVAAACGDSARAGHYKQVSDPKVPICDEEPLVVRNKKPSKGIPGVLPPRREPTSEEWNRENAAEGTWFGWALFALFAYVLCVFLLLAAMARGVLVDGSPARFVDVAALLSRPGSARTVALMRIALAAQLWGRFSEELQVSWLLGDARRGSGLGSRLPASLHVALPLAFYAATTSMLVGYRARLSTFASAACACVLCCHVHSHHVRLLTLATAWLSLTPCGASYSVDRWLAVRRSSSSTGASGAGGSGAGASGAGASGAGASGAGASGASGTGAAAAWTTMPSETADLWARPLLKLQLSAVYFFAALQKTNLAFLDGHRLDQLTVYFYFSSSTHPYCDPLGALPSASDAACDVWSFALIAASVGVVALEYSLAIAVWWPPRGVVSRALLHLGVAMHAAMYVALPVSVLSCTMCTLYLIWVDPDEAHEWLDRLHGSGHAATASAATAASAASAASAAASAPAASTDGTAASSGPVGAKTGQNGKAPEPRGLFAATAQPPPGSGLLATIFFGFPPSQIDRMKRECAGTAVAVAVSAVLIGWLLVVDLEGATEGMLVWKENRGGPKYITPWSRSPRRYPAGAAPSPPPPPPPSPSPHAMYRNDARRTGHVDVDAPPAVELAWRVRALNKGTHTACKGSAILAVPPPPRASASEAERAQHDEALLVVGGDTGTLWAYRLDGTVAWGGATWPSHFGIHGTACVVGGGWHDARRPALAVIGAYDGALYAFRLRDGFLQWRAQVGQYIGASPLCDHAGGRVLISVEFDGPARGALAALDAADGAELARFDGIGGHSHSSVAIHHDGAHGVAMVGGNAGVLYGVDATTLAPRWRFQTDGAATGGGQGAVKMAVAVATTPAGALAVFGSFDRAVYAVHVATGALAWRYATEGRIIGAAAVDDESGLVFVGSMDGSMYALEGATGALRWSFHTDGAIFSSPTLTRAHVLFGSNDGHLYCLKKADGAFVWRWIQGRTGAITSTPLVTDDLVAFTSRTYQNKDDNDCNGKCVGPGDLIVLRRAALK